MGTTTYSASQRRASREHVAYECLLKAHGRRAIRAFAVVALLASAGTGMSATKTTESYGSNPDTGEIGYAGTSSPGNAPSAITVGAVLTHGTARRDDGEVAPFSSRGPTWYEGWIKPDVVAPGDSLVAISSASSALYRNQKLRADVTPYLKLSGTSMAAAVTSGVIALMIEASRKEEGWSVPLAPDAIQAILEHSAVPVRDDGELTTLEQGAGGVNAAGALTLVRAINRAAPVGEPWLEIGVPFSSKFAGQVMSWNQHSIWGDRILWGDHILWGDSLGRIGDRAQ
jgi:serine protease AprX